MKIKLATWYMETAWMKLGTLRNVRFFHRLFNIAYGARRAEYKEQIMSLPPLEVA